MGQDTASAMLRETGGRNTPVGRLFLTAACAVIVDGSPVQALTGPIWCLRTLVSSLLRRLAACVSHASRHVCVLQEVREPGKRSDQLLRARRFFAQIIRLES